MTRLSSELAIVLKYPAVAERLVTNGTEPSFMGPHDFRKVIEDELVKYGKIVEGLKK